MKKIFPQKLKSGDRIMVVAPSSSAASLKKTASNLAVRQAKNFLGLKAVFSKNALEKDILGSSSVKSRVADLNAAFSDRLVSGIACVRGGYNVNTILNYLDWGSIKKNPKPLWGFSDITVLANAIYAKTGIVSYIGPNFSTFGLKENTEYTFEYFKKCLMENSAYELLPSKKFGERGVPFKKNPGYKILRPGTAEGTIIGGHLSSLNLLQGTKFMPSLKDSVLFLETDDYGGKDSVFEFERDLQSLLHYAGTGDIRGVVFGRFQKGSFMTKEKLGHIVLSKDELQGVPIVTSADFGHTYPIATIPIGGKCELFAKEKKVRIVIHEH